MAVVDALDKVGKWLGERVCPRVKLKIPPEDRNARQDEGYDYKLGLPQVHVLYLPTAKTKPPGVHYTAPGIVVQPVEGNDDLTTQSRDMRVRLSFLTWDPGRHGPDTFYPRPGEPLPRGVDPTRAYGMFAQPNEPAFQATHEGWRDAWNLMDVAIREVENAEAIEGMAVSRNAKVSYGPYLFDEAPVDFYPYWMLWAEFTISEPLRRNRQDIDTLIY